MDRPQAPPRHYASPRIVSALLDEVADRGLDPAHLATRVGLSLPALRNPRRGLPVAALLALYDAAADALDAPTLGLELAERASLGDYGVAGYLVVHHDTLREGLAAGCRAYTALLGISQLVAEPVTGGVRYRLAFDHAVPGRHLWSQHRLAGLHRASREATGRVETAPLAVSFTAEAPADPTPYEAAFGGVSVGFAAPHDAIVLADRVLDRPLPRRDPALRRHLEDALARQLQRQDTWRDRDGRLRLVGCTVDMVRSEVVRAGEVQTLTTTEHRLLAYLIAHANTLVTHEDLDREVWGHPERTRSEAPAVAIRRLRRRIEPVPTEPVNLITHPGRGWVLRVPQDPYLPWRLDAHEVLPPSSD